MKFKLIQIYYIFLCAILFFMPSCNSSSKNTNHNQRIIELNNAKSDDKIIQYFLTFIKENNIEEAILEYEDDLIKRNLLESPSIESYKKYVSYLVKNEEEKSCITDAVQKKFNNVFAKFKFPLVEDKYGTNDTENSKEYNFYNYLMSGGTVILPALEYAIENNNLTIEKKLFYLFLMMPSKICD